MTGERIGADHHNDFRDWIESRTFEIVAPVAWRPQLSIGLFEGDIIREPPVSAPIAGIRPSLKSSQNSETFSVEKCMKSEVDPGKLVTSRNSDSVGQLFSFRYLQKGRLQIDAQPNLIP